MSLSEVTDRALQIARVDWSPRHRQPSPLALAVATVLSVGGSLAVDALLVFIGTRLFPSTKGYTHFRLSDYGTLTVIGVLVACIGWPVVTRISSAPRWLFLRLAVLVTLVLWIPDLYILAQGQPPRAVAVLMAMHLAIALVTYNVLVDVAPVREQASPSRVAEPARERVPGVMSDEEVKVAGRSATWLAVLVAVEFALGVASLFRLPIARPTGGLPDRGGPIYLAHAAIGFPLGVFAAAYLLRYREATRTYKMVAWLGFGGAVVAAFGGILTVIHPLRIFGMFFMLAGAVVALFGYIIPTLERLPRDEAYPPQSSQAPPRSW